MYLLLLGTINLSVEHESWPLNFFKGRSFFKVYKTEADALFTGDSYFSLSISHIWWDTENLNFVRPWYNGQDRHCMETLGEKSVQDLTVVIIDLSTCDDTDLSLGQQKLGLKLSTNCGSWRLLYLVSSSTGPRTCLYQSSCRLYKFPKCRFFVALSILYMLVDGMSCLELNKITFSYILLHSSSFKIDDDTKNIDRPVRKLTIPFRLPLNGFITNIDFVISSNTYKCVFI